MKWYIIALIVFGIVVLIGGLIIFEPQLSLLGINPLQQKGIVSASGELLSASNPNSPDFDYSSIKIITLNITTTEGSFEKYIDIDFDRINDTEFLIHYKLNESLLNDLQIAKANKDVDTIKYLKALNDIIIKYFKSSNSSLSDLNNSINSLSNYPIKNLTSNIKVTGKIDLNNEGSFIIDLTNYDKTNISKSAGEQVKIGFSSLVIETVDSTNDVGQYSSIALDSNGFVHISEYDATNKDLRYCNNTNGWTCSIVESTNDVGRQSSIALDSNNKVHIIEFRYYSTLAQYFLRYCNNTASNGAWSCKEFFDSAYLFGANYPPSIAIDSNDKVHISSSNPVGGCLSHITNANDSWVYENVSCNISTVSPSSIAIGSNNVVHIAVKLSTNYLGYCNNSGGSWSCVSTGLSNIFSTSIAIDSNDKVHIATNPGIGDLGYCNNTASNGAWSCNLIDTPGTTGQSPSIAIDSNNVIHISEYRTTPTLKYCNNSGGSWSCIVLTTVSANSLGTPTGRALAIKQGRIVDSTSFSTAVHGSFYNNTDLIYWNYTISGGVSDTCTYTSGNWVMDCSDNCTISSNVTSNLITNSFSAIGYGNIVLNANISNFTNYLISGGCNITCAKGCIKI